MKKAKWILWILMLVMLPNIVSAYNCLFLSSISDPGGAASEPMMFWLMDEGHELTIVGSRDFWTWTKADVTAFDFMFVCEVVDSATLFNNLFTDAGSDMSFEGHPIPVVTTENYAARANTFAYTTSSSTENYGAEKIEIVDGDHPLAAGYATGKKVTVNSGSGTMNDLIPNNPEIDFIPIAKGTSIPGYIIYGVDKGVLTVNGVETVNRGAVCGYHAEGYNALTDEGYDFLNAAVAWVMEGASPVEDNAALSSKAYALNQNYPNPFNPTTQISFNLNQAAQTTLTVYNALGQKVTTLVDANLSSGYHQITFDSNQYNLESGVYYYEIKSGSFSQVNKMLLMK